MPAAIARHILPNSPKYGFPWVQQPDGSVTFRERGFVSAPSPAMLLARHNFELARIHGELHDIRARRSLEIGCGFGRLSMAIAEHSDSHIAIDINEDALAVARATYPDIDYRSGGALSLPFADDYFDLAVTWTVLQHIRPAQSTPQRQRPAVSWRPTRHCPSAKRRGTLRAAVDTPGIDPPRATNRSCRLSVLCATD